MAKRRPPVSLRLSYGGSPFVGSAVNKLQHLAVITQAATCLISHRRPDIPSAYFIPARHDTRMAELSISTYTLLRSRNWRTAIMGANRITVIPAGMVNTLLHITV